MRVVLEGVRWRPFAGASFEKATVVDGQGKEWLNAAGGELRLEPALHGFKQRFFLSEFSLHPAFFQSLPALPLPGEGMVDANTLRFHEAVFTLEGARSARCLRLLKMNSPVLELHGSVWWKDGRVEKADILVGVPNVWAGRLPQNLAKRLSSSSGGKKTIKCAYKNDQLTLYGASGRLLRAAWSPEGVNGVERT